MESLLDLCHHLLGIHGGWISVEGHAGDRLVWRFRGSGVGGEEGETWITEGYDDVRRMETPDRNGSAQAR